MKHILLLFFIGIYSSAFSQPSISWQKCIGGTDGDQGIFVTRTHDNGFIVTGVASSADGDITNSHGGDEVLVIRFDSANNVVWKKNYGGSSDDAATCIIETPDHGFIFCAGTESDDGDVTSNYGDNDIWVVRIDSVGNLLWQKSFGDTSYDDPFTIIQNSNGDYVIGGSTTKGNYDYDFCLICIDPSGNLIWQKSYGGSDEEWGYEVIQTIDGGYMLSGWTVSIDGDVTFNHGESDVWLVKTDAIGNLQWQKTYGGSYSEYLSNIIQLANGQYVFAAVAGSDDGDIQNTIMTPDFWIVKIDATGNILSQKIYGGTGDDEPYRMIHTSDNGFMVTGSTGSNDIDVSGNHGDWDSWTVKLDSNLNKEWAFCSGGDDEDLTYGICELPSGDYVLTGYTYSNNGDVSGNHGGGYEDIWTFRISTSTGIPEIISGNNMQLFPNPCSSILNVQFHSSVDQECIIHVKDVCGKTVQQKNISADIGMNRVTLNTTLLERGIYFITINLNDKVFSKSLVIE